MLKSTDQFYERHDEPNKGCLLALRSILLQHDADMSETVKYGMPCFCYRDKALCYLWIDKCTNEPYILLVEGMRIDHPDLEQGSRKRMKIFRVQPNEDLPLNTIKYLLDSSIKLRQ